MPLNLIVNLVPPPPPSGGLPRGRVYQLRNISMAIEILDWLRFTYVFENRSA
jgi:hypothetical protein